MYQASSGYFGWQASSNGQLRATGAAPDGEEYFVTALILAAKRWGDGSGIFAYSTEAKNLLTALATRGAFDTGSHIVTFGVGTGYSDPSYVLPAFYEMWACFDSKNQAFFKAAASAGRAFFPKNVNAKTSLCSYLANFNGSPHPSGPDFNSDSWRCVGNIMMDYHLYHVDSWQATFAKTYAAFFKNELPKRPMPDEYRLDGTVKVTHADPAKGLIAEHALVAFGVPPEDGKVFVQALWDLDIPSGTYRYYDSMLYFLTFLHVSGRFRIY
jgi:oligosaccharide reducing-end xylanase